MTPRITTGHTDDTAAVACTLTPAGLTAQAGRWQQLLALAMTERAETADGLRVSFRPDLGAEEELRRLVAVESECCRWADWTVHTSPTAIVLDVRSTGTGIATLHGMFHQPVTESIPANPPALVNEHGKRARRHRRRVDDRSRRAAVRRERVEDGLKVVDGAQVQLHEVTVLTGDPVALGVVMYQQERK